jgi:hypothetical protein
VPATSPAPLHDYPYPDIWAHGIDEFDNDIEPASGTTLGEGGPRQRHVHPLDPGNRVQAAIIAREGGPGRLPTRGSAAKRSLPTVTTGPPGVGVVRMWCVATAARRAEC